MNTLILFIDDDPISNFVGSRTLEHFNFTDEVISCMSGFEALDFLKKSIAENRIPDIIFLDLYMPKMDGWRFLEEFRKLGITKEIKIVILTSSVYSEDTKKAKEYKEVCDYITKPLKVEDLKVLRDHHIMIG